MRPVRRPLPAAVALSSFFCLSDYRSSSLSLPSFCRLTLFPRGHRSRAPPTALTHSFSNQLTLHINVPRGASRPEPQIWKGRLARPGRSGSIPSQLSQTCGFIFLLGQQKQTKKGVCEEKLKQPGVRVQRGCSPLMAELRIRWLANLIPVLQRLWVTHTKHKKRDGKESQSHTHTHTHTHTDGQT